MAVRAEAGAGARGTGRADRWWNFTVLGADISFFSLGLSISSAYTMQPLFVNHLTANNVAIALIPAIRAFGLYAPQLLVAPLVERLRHALPYILLLTILERVPYLVIALGAIWLAGHHDGALLALYFAMIFVALLGGGLTFPAWLDMIARTIPRAWLGRFMGLWTGVGSVLGIGGAAVAAIILARLSWPSNFALCFALTFAAMVVSYGLLALGREPARAAPAGRQSEKRAAGVARRNRRDSLAGLREQGRELAQLVRGDEALRRLLIGNALVGVSTMAAALYAVSALKLGSLTDAEVGVESTILFVAMTVGNFAWGWVGDHAGHRAVLVGGAACAALAALLGLAAHGFVAYAAVFLVLGLSLSGVQLAGFTLITEFGPEERRPTYVALASVGYAPFAIGAPLVGGAIANAWGYAPVFILTAIAGLGGAALIQFWVPDPRRLRTAIR